MALDIQVQTGEVFSSPGDMRDVILAIAGHQLFPAVSKDGDDVVLNTSSIVWIKEKP